MDLRGLLPAKGLLAQVGDFAVNIEILSLEMMQLVREREHFGPQRGAYLEVRGARIILELAQGELQKQRVSVHSELADQLLDLMRISARRPAALALLAELDGRAIAAGFAGEGGQVVISDLAPPDYFAGDPQVYAPRDICRTSKFRLDRLYLKRAGFCLDMRLILLSFWITGRGQWENRNRRV